MGILSIQSQVASGHVGNSAAVFALQRLGREVWPIPTMLLSHHPGHGGAEGGPVQPAMIDRILNGLAARGCFGRCQAVHSGYLGQAETAACVLRAVALAKTGAPNAVFLCDPVLGDDGRLYVREEIVEPMRDLAAKADIVTPNAFELALLSGDDFRTRAGALQAMRRLQDQGPHIVVLSSLQASDTPAGSLDMLAIDAEAAWLLNVPRLEQKFNGAGDLFAALFLDDWLERRDTKAAFARAGTAVQSVLAKTSALGLDELALIQAQHILAAPRRLLPERIA